MITPPGASRRVILLQNIHNYADDHKYKIGNETPINVAPIIPSRIKGVFLRFISVHDKHPFVNRRHATGAAILKRLCVHYCVVFSCAVGQGDVGGNDVRLPINRSFVTWFSRDYILILHEIGKLH